MENNIISKWLEQHGEPVVNKYISINLQIAQAINDAMESKAWDSNDLALHTNTTEDTITKWLTGTHPFTLKELVLIEHTLDIKILQIN